MMKFEIIVAPLSAVVALISLYFTNHAQTEIEIYRADEIQKLEKLKSELESTKNKEIEMLKSELEVTKNSLNMFMQQQLAIYLDASRIASLISISGNKSDKLRDDFFTLYWGNLAVFEDDAVSKAMVDFGTLLKKPAAGETELQNASLRLAHACRDSLEKAWDVDLGPLNNYRVPNK